MLSTYLPRDIFVKELLKCGDIFTEEGAGRIYGHIKQLPVDTSEHIEVNHVAVKFGFTNFSNSRKSFRLFIYIDIHPLNTSIDLPISRIISLKNCIAG